MKPAVRMGIARKWFARIGLVVVTAGAIAAFIAAWNAQLPTPPVAPSQWNEWLSSHDPMDLVVAAARVITLVSAGYICVALTLSTLAQIYLPSSLRHRMEKVLPGIVTTLTVTAVLGSAPAGAAELVVEPRDATPVMRVVAQEVPTMRQAEQPPAQQPPEQAPAPVEQKVLPATVIVAPGDHLWSIAHRDLLDVFDAEPTFEQTELHWVRLIDINRDRLADPDNPDLVFAGQTFLLPR